MSYEIPEDVPSTSHVRFLSGAYSLGQWTIPYFVATLTAKAAAQDLRLTKEMPGSSGVEWRISELYQREVDWRRVETQIVPYLNNSSEPQFFNALTVALMPYSLEGQQLLEGFTNGEWASPELGRPEIFQKVIDVGPIKLGFYDDWQQPTDDGFRMGVMRWNPEQVHAVAIDGQHRLAALKEFVRSHPAAKAEVPVIFLIFDERLGFRMFGSDSITAVLRRVFIDLNKHAKTVMRARQILLDDRDPVSLCVRGLLSDKLSEGVDSIWQPPYELPLSLVDWHSEKAKFDEGPYLTTVLQVDWIVSRVLGTTTLTDSTDYDGFRKQIRALASSLNVDFAEVESRIQGAEEAEVPFSYTDSELEGIEATFRAVWNKPLVELVTRYRPYAELVNLRAENETLGRPWQLWYQLWSAAERGGSHSKRELEEFQQELQYSDPPVTPKKLAERLDAIEGFKGNSLAFKVVYQKALVDAALEFLKFKPANLDELGEWLDAGAETFQDAPYESAAIDLVADADEGDMADVPDAETLMSRFIAAMNFLDEKVPDFLSLDFESGGPDDPGRRFWLGSLLKGEGGVDFTQAAAKRASDVIFVSACLSELAMLEKADSVETTEVIGTITDPDDWPFWKRLSRANRRLWSGPTSAGGRILTLLDADYSEVGAQFEMEKRWSFLWSELKR